MAKKTRGKGEGSIYQDGRGYWCASIELPPTPLQDRRRKVIRRKSKADTVREFRKLRKELEETGTISNARLTVQKWLEIYAEKILPSEERPNTVKGHTSAIQNHIIPHIGKIRLDKLQPSHVRDMHEKILQTPNRLKPGTTISTSYAKKIWVILNRALNVAVREKQLGRNPLENVPLPDAQIGKRKAFTLDESLQLLRHCLTDEYGAMWITFLLTGARLGEVIGLEKDRVTDELDLSWQLQRISNMDQAKHSYEHEQVYRTLYKVRPKSQSGWRRIPLVDPLASTLRRHIDRDTENTTSFVFVNHRLGRPFYPDEVRELWRRTLEAAELPAVDMHGVRHTTVDLLYLAGVPEHIISEIVGHATGTMTRSYRTEGSRALITDAMKKLSASLGA